MRKHLHRDYTPIIAGIIGGILVLCWFVYPTMQDVSDARIPDRMFFSTMVDDSATYLGAPDPEAPSRVQHAVEGLQQFALKHYESGFSLRLFGNAAVVRTVRVPRSPMLAAGTKEVSWEAYPSKFDYAVEVSTPDVAMPKPAHEHHVLVLVADKDDPVEYLTLGKEMETRLAKDDVSLYFIKFTDFAAAQDARQMVMNSHGHIILVPNQESFKAALEDIYTAERKEADAASKTKLVWSAFTTILMTAFLLLFLLGFLCCWGIIKHRSQKRAH